MLLIQKIPLRKLPVRRLRSVPFSSTACERKSWERSRRWTRIGSWRSRPNTRTPTSPGQSSTRRRNTRRRLTQAELARAIRSSQSRVAKMEAGDPTVSIDLLVKSLLALGVSKKELGRVIS
ncbi:MAG: helix-turn-helix transcriptional regulator [Woeseia sp.]